MILLIRRPDILIQAPLDIALPAVHYPSPDLEQPHTHPWAHLSKFNTIVFRPYIYVMPDVDQVVLIAEGYDPVSGCFTLVFMMQEKQMLQYSNDTFAQGRAEAMEYHVGVDF
jgi:hypothetical protein